jgi:hypothetical protein
MTSFSSGPRLQGCDCGSCWSIVLCGEKSLGQSCELSSAARKAHLQCKLVCISHEAEESGDLNRIEPSKSRDFSQIRCAERPYL